ncbi:unnamed protein product [Lactuca virosa]|uniref:Uncharacterized protein n=1 Tax=Lactuca virosa TaxID=75947 RepID=A0AAU9P9F2_9ASTR|nr:unnamed protein product [Lactuca virosa]
MFSRLGRSISRLSRSRVLTDSSAYQSRDDKLGVSVLRRYLGSLAANNQRNGSGLGLSSKLYTSDMNYILPNPRIRRFSSNPNKKESSKSQKRGSFQFIICVPLLLGFGSMLCSWLLYKLLCKEVDKLLVICQVLGEEKDRGERNMDFEAEEQKEGY